MRFAAFAQSLSPITYADPTAPLWERAFVNAIDPFGLDGVMSGTADINGCTMPTDMKDASIDEDTAQFIKDTVDTYSEIPGAPGSNIYKGFKNFANGDIASGFFEIGKDVTLSGPVGFAVDVLEKLLPDPPIDPETGRVVFPDNGFPEYNNTGY